MDRVRCWFAAHGGSVGERVVLDAHGPFGVSVLAPRRDEDLAAVTCPFSLIITRQSSAQALQSLLGPAAHASLDTWSERQLISSYLCFHHLCPPASFPAVLAHLPYVQCLPPAACLLTPLYFTTTERELLRGTNLYGATLDRERDWRADWVQCQALVQNINPAWSAAFTWEVYMAASTHLSSRAFPSSILSPNPSLVTSPSTSPVLIPVVDFLNHKRGQPVSWIVSCQDVPTSSTMSIVVHPDPNPDSDPNTAPGSDVTSHHEALVEVFNNYGPKPNDELVLAYGFSIPDNPDDTIILQIGGATASQKWVVGRSARNVDGLWSDVRGRVVDAVQNEHAFEDDLETAAVLSDMVQAKLDGMKTVADVQSCDQIRPTVRAMLEHYIAGQREILESILGFTNEKQREAIETARKQGIDLVFDDDDDDDDN